MARVTNSRNVAVFVPLESSNNLPSITLNKPLDGSLCEDYVASLTDFAGKALAQLKKLEAKFTPEEYTTIKEKFLEKIGRTTVAIQNSKELTYCRKIFEEYVATLPKATKGGKRNTRRRKSNRRKTQRRR